MIQHEPTRAAPASLGPSDRPKLGRLPAHGVPLAAAAIDFALATQWSKQIILSAPRCGRVRRREGFGVPPPTG
jgi:hypothetical protein